MDYVQELILKKEKEIMNNEELEKLNLIKEITKNEDCFFNFCEKLCWNFGGDCIDFSL